MFWFYHIYVCVCICDKIVVLTCDRGCGFWGESEVNIAKILEGVGGNLWIQSLGAPVESATDLNGIFNRVDENDLFYFFTSSIVISKHHYPLLQSEKKKKMNKS